MTRNGRSRAVHRAELEVIAPGSQRIGLLAELTLDHGEGAVVFDLDGNRYVDFFAGVGVASLGHAHPRWVEAIAEQAGRIAVGSFTTESRLTYLEKLREVLPGRLGRVQLYSSGAEAVESAIRLARAATGKHEVVGFWGGFHGKTAGVMGLIGDAGKHGWGPFPGGRTSVPYADCNRCPLALRYPSCGVACADLAREAIRNQTGGDVAAILIEPMQGTAGNVVPPPEFLRAVRGMADDLGALLVADEMITGFGRTGAMFGVEHAGVEPDVMTLGKGMAGGFPVSAVVSRDDVVAAEPWSKPSASSSSYGGNPLAAAAALATLEVILEERLVDRSRILGERLLAGLREVERRSPFVTAVRGVGLLVGFDLVDPDTRAPLDRARNEAFFRGCLARGLLLMGYQPRVRIQPPLTITEAELDEGLASLEGALADLEGKRS